MHPIRIIVYGSHTFFFLSSFLPNTAISECLHNKSFVLPILYMILWLSLIYFYKKATSDPYYVDDDSPLLYSSQDGLFFCTKCNHYCPIRAIHCDQCHKCVYRKDHHCPFLDTCVGMGNHLFFIIFLTILFVYDVLTIYIFSSSLMDRIDIIEWVLFSLPCDVSFFGSMISIIQPTFLVPIHLYLAFFNVTTWEYIKNRSASYLSSWTRTLSPFSKGIKNNIKEFITMHKTHPIYHVPSTPEEIEEWEKENESIINSICC